MAQRSGPADSSITAPAVIQALRFGGRVYTLNLTELRAAVAERVRTDELTYDEVAEMVGYHRSTLWRVLDGRGSADAVAALLRVLGPEVGARVVGDRGAATELTQAAAPLRQPRDLEIALADALRLACRGQHPLQLIPRLRRKLETLETRLLAEA